MDHYYQGAVENFLRANRSVFVNAEFLLQISDKPADAPRRGEHWFIDMLAVNLVTKECNLCEITYARNTPALAKRLISWKANWSRITAALQECAGIPGNYIFRPWLFVPAREVEAPCNRADDMLFGGLSPFISTLEKIAPWAHKEILTNNEQAVLRNCLSDGADKIVPPSANVNLVE